MGELTVREYLEEQEHKILSPYASFSDESQGRDRKETPCDLRLCYQRDRDRILHCKAFRRLKHKTQVFLEPVGDHYRTRLTHTLEVAQIARTIARSLRLNEDLTEAIALGHDLGHTPFGHAGERALNRVCSRGFCHREQSIRVVELLENEGQGMNLTWEVRDGIRNHATKCIPSTLEGKIVRLSDKIAYINHDIDDAVRGKIITEQEIPYCYREILGYSFGERLDTLVKDIVCQSREKDEILMSKPVEKAMFGLRSYMMEYVYTNPLAKGEEGKAENVVEELFTYYMEHEDLLPAEYLLHRMQGEPSERVVCDYIAGMSDPYAIAQYQSVKIPSFWTVQ